MNSMEGSLGILAIMFAWDGEIVEEIIEELAMAGYGVSNSSARAELGDGGRIRIVLEIDAIIILGLVASNIALCRDIIVEIVVDIEVVWLYA